eukprot:2660845-Lingulodinium_polyedra.AAC.1
MEVCSLCRLSSASLSSAALGPFGSSLPRLRRAAAVLQPPSLARLGTAGTVLQRFCITASIASSAPCLTGRVRRALWGPPALRAAPP